MQNKDAFARKVFNELCKTKYGTTVCKKYGGSCGKDFNKISGLLTISDKNKRLSTIKYFADKFDVPESFVAQIFKYEGAEEIIWENW